MKLAVAECTIELPQSSVAVHVTLADPVAAQPSDKPVKSFSTRAPLHPLLTPALLSH